MTNPVHSSPTRSDRTATAPYNFVPLPEQVVTVPENDIPGHDRYEHNNGWIGCTLLAESHLYTRAAMDSRFFVESSETEFDKLSEAQRKERAQFFTVGRTDAGPQLAIPGSSLRGMTRSLVEIAAYGKMQWVTDESLFFRSIGDRSSLAAYYGRFFINRSEQVFESRAMPGYLSKVGAKWYIVLPQTVSGVRLGRIERTDIESIDGVLDGWHGCANARIIYVHLEEEKDHPHSRATLRYAKVKEASNKPGPGLEEMVLVETRRVGRKHLQFVFGLPSTERIPIKEGIIELYRSQITEGQREQLLNMDGVLQHMQPVFYLLEENQVKFFGHTMMFRLPYEKTPFDFVPQELRQEDAIDLAEAIFGFEPVPGRLNGQGMAGRVFFSDAMVLKSSGENLEPEPIILRVLGGPKPTAFPHYLTQQEPDDIKKLHHYDSPLNQAVIRGHKLYWHKKDVSLADIREEREGEINKHATQYTLIRPVKPGTMFAFVVHFENLTDCELGCLLWVLSLPGKDGRTYRHKLGMGKPLGMGSVKITADLHLTDRKSRYKQLFSDDRWNHGCEVRKSVNDLAAAFEEYVLERIDPAERKDAKRLVDLERIQALLRLLEWSDLDKEKTAYMPLETFKERKVLPSPLSPVYNDPD